MSQNEDHFLIRWWRDTPVLFRLSRGLWCCKAVGMAEIMEYLRDYMIVEQELCCMPETNN